MRGPMRAPRAEERLERTMDVFWTKGYYDTSLDESVNRTGLPRAAVYGTFSSKRELFAAALQRYRNTIIADYLVGSVLGLWTLARSPAPAATLRHYVDGVLGFLDGLQPDGRARHRTSRRSVGGRS
jgi:AcrR family transcriptional regulator